MIKLFILTYAIESYARTDACSRTLKVERPRRRKPIDAGRGAVMPSLLSEEKRGGDG